jgi:RNA polymerase sigma factor (sigma-70 family)
MFPLGKLFHFPVTFAVIACSCLIRVSHPMPKTISNDLALFSKNGDEAAFRRVVDALSGLAFSSAMRRSADRGMAEEVTQNVFAILARKASKLHGHSSLEGWIFTTTRYEAAMAMRKRQQHLRKLEALEMESSTKIELNAGSENLPHLEESLDRLAAADREILLSRFFSGHSFAEIAEQTGRTEAACKMRVKRTLEKLHGWLTSRGVKVSATALVAGLSAEWAKAAPVSFAASLPANALASAPAVTSFQILTNTLITMNALKTTITCVAIILAIGAVPFGIERSRAKEYEKTLTLLHESRPQAIVSAVEPSRLSETPTRVQAPSPLVNPDAFMEKISAIVLTKTDLFGMIRVMEALRKLTPEETEKFLDLALASSLGKRPKETAFESLLLDYFLEVLPKGLVFERVIAADLDFKIIELQAFDWGEQDIAGMVEWFLPLAADGRFEGRGLGADSPQTMLMEILMQRLSEVDPGRAFELLPYAHPDSLRKIAQPVLEAIVDLPGGREKVAGFIQAQENEFERYLLIKQLATDKKSWSLDEVAQLALGAGLEGEMFGRLLADQAALPKRGSMQEKGDWLLKTLASQEPGALAEAVSTFVRKTYDVDAPESAAWIESLPAGVIRDTAKVQQVRVLGSKKRGAESIAQAQTIATDSLRNEALVHVTRDWLIQDEAAAGAWLDSLPPGEIRDKALQGKTVFHVKNEDFSRAMEAVGEVGTELRRSTLVEYVLIVWRRQDEQAARQAATRLGIDLDNINN